MNSEIPFIAGFNIDRDEANIYYKNSIDDSTQQGIMNLLNEAFEGMSKFNPTNMIALKWNSSEPEV